MSILIVWKTQKYQIDMIKEFGSKWEDSTKLRDLIQSCSNLTGIPNDGIHLLTSGGKILIKFSLNSY